MIQSKKLHLELHKYNYFLFLFYFKMTLQSNLGQTTNLGDVIEYIIDTIINDK